MMPAKTRKPREAPPPGDYVRSTGGTPARLRRTSRTTSDGRWLYRLDFGSVVGSQEWTVADLEAAGVRWLRRRPTELRDSEVRS